MGYCIWSEEGSIKIKKENMKMVLQKLSDFFKNGGELRWVTEFDLDDENYNEEDSLSLEEIWSNLRYEYKETDTYYEIVEFLGDKLGDDLKFFELIAEYCENGYLQFAGEDGEHFRIVIDDGEAVAQWATLNWGA